MNLLVDTSVWVDYLRGDDTAARSELRSLLAQRSTDVVMTEPVAMELLAGATDEVMLTRLERLADGLPTLTVDPALDFRSAAAIQRACRRAGRTARSIVDCFIAAVAIRNDAQLLHNDADFETIAAVTPLDSRSLR